MLARSLTYRSLSYLNFFTFACMSENNKSQHIVMLEKIIVLMVHFDCILHMKTLLPYSEQGGFFQQCSFAVQLVDLNSSQQVRDLMKQLSFSTEYYFLYMCIYFSTSQQVIQIQGCLVFWFFFFLLKNTHPQYCN